MKKKSILLFVLMVFFNACAVNPPCGCKPVLMPYVEYEYKAEPKKLANAYVQGNEKNIDFHGIRMAAPKGWKYKIAFDGKAVDFFKDKESRFLLLFETNKDLRDDFENFNLIGCKNFKTKKIKKSSKEFYSDLYSFTDDQLDSESGFWQYFILWAKTDFLHDAIKLTHYSGDNIDVFQRISDPRTACGKAGIIMQSEIFLKKIAPDYLTIAAGFRDDAFFLNFFEMLNMMNP